MVKRRGSVFPSGGSLLSPFGEGESNSSSGLKSSKLTFFSVFAVCLGVIVR